MARRPRSRWVADVAAAASPRPAPAPRRCVCRVERRLRVGLARGHVERARQGCGAGQLELVPAASSSSAPRGCARRRRDRGARCARGGERKIWISARVASSSSRLAPGEGRRGATHPPRGAGRAVTDLRKLEADVSGGLAGGSRTRRIAERREAAWARRAGARGARVRGLQYVGVLARQVAAASRVVAHGSSSNSTTAYWRRGAPRRSPPPRVGGRAGCVADRVERRCPPQGSRRRPTGARYSAVPRRRGRVRHRCGGRGPAPPVLALGVRRAAPRPRRRPARRVGAARGATRAPPAQRGGADWRSSSLWPVRPAGAAAASSPPPPPRCPGGEQRTGGEARRSSVAASMSTRAAQTVALGAGVAVGHDPGARRPPTAAAGCGGRRRRRRRRRRRWRRGGGVVRADGGEGEIEGWREETVAAAEWRRGRAAGGAGAS